MSKVETFKSKQNLILLFALIMNSANSKLLSFNKPDEQRGQNSQRGRKEEREPKPQT